MSALDRYNLSFGELNTIKWIHSGDVFGEVASAAEEGEDQEAIDRDAIKWPCPLQDHTRAYLESMESKDEKLKFLEKRSARFTRKLTRHTPQEAKTWYRERKCDSVIIAARYDPTETLLSVMPRLSPTRSMSTCGSISSASRGLWLPGFST